MNEKCAFKVWSYSLTESASYITKWRFRLNNNGLLVYGQQEKSKRSLICITLQIRIIISFLGQELEQIMYVSSPREENILNQGTGRGNQSEGCNLDIVIEIELAHMNLVK